MDLQQLFYFVTVYESSTFTAASMKLHISQPSLSISIKKLEEEMGFTLLDRSKRRLRLTKEGEVLYHEAKKLLIHFEHVTNEMDRLKKEGPLELSIGIIESSKFWVPKVLAAFKEENQEVYIRLLEVLSLKDVEKSLIEFETHIAITNQYISNNRIKSIPLYDERLVALIPLNHPLKDKSFLTIKDLENEKFIISKEGFQTREDILKAFQKSGVKPKLHFEIGRFETACDLVEEGLGITVAPENYVRHMNSSKFTFKRIHDSNISRTVYLAYDNDRYMPPIVNRFMTSVLRYFNKEEGQLVSDTD